MSFAFCTETDSLNINFSDTFGIRTTLLNKNISTFFQLKLRLDH